MCPDPPVAFKDLFSRDSAAYARFRPRYPAELFEWLAGLPAGRDLAWDCATGNGQAAERLVPLFRYVVGTDASLPQLRAARRAAGLGYCAGLAESSCIASRRVDLITVAQAFHWLDPERFYAEVDRVAAPGAVLAVWAYGRLRATPGVDALINHFHDLTVGPYWTPERKQVEEGYRSARLPIDELSPPDFAIQARLTLAELVGYLGTWSAVGRFRTATGTDPVAPLAAELGRLWGDPAERRPVTWPLVVRAGRWSGWRGRGGQAAGALS